MLWPHEDLFQVLTQTVEVFAAEEDEDCDALWSMFDVNDLDEGIAQPKAQLSLAISQTQTASQGQCNPVFLQ